MGPPIWYPVLTGIWEKIKGTTQFGTRVPTDFEKKNRPTHRLWVGTRQVDPPLAKHATSLHGRPQAEGKLALLPLLLGAEWLTKQVC